MKAAQPPDQEVDPTARRLHELAVLNGLRNADTHRKLTVVAAMLMDPELTWTNPDGSRSHGEPVDLAPDSGLTEDAEFYGIPDAAANVQVRGTPHVVIRVGEFDRGFRMVEGFREQVYEPARVAAHIFRPFVLPP